MEIKLQQNDIEQAIQTHLKNKGLDLQNKIITMEFTAGRKKGNGTSVDISINDDPNARTAASVDSSAARSEVLLAADSPTAITGNGTGPADAENHNSEATDHTTHEAPTAPWDTPVEPAEGEQETPADAEILFG